MYEKYANTGCLKLLVNINEAYEDLKEIKANHIKNRFSFR